MEIFKSRPDIFPSNEIDQITEGSNFSSTNNHYKIVAESDNKVAGFTDVLLNSQNIWMLNWLAVGDLFQKQGVGSSLVNLIIEWLLKKGVKELQVQTCSCDGEAPARAFYEKRGFVPIKTEKNGYGKGHSKITFLKEL